MSLRSTDAVLADDVTVRVSQLGLRRNRGCRAGRAVQARRARPVPVLQPVVNGAYIVCTPQRADALPLPRRRSVYGSNVRYLTRVTVQRHTSRVGRNLQFGSMNMRSLSPLKLDALLDEFRGRTLDVALLCETWHDADSVVLQRLRTEGFQVVERARPRSRRIESSLAINHGGVAIVATAGICLSAISVGVKPATFEYVAARVTAGTSSCAVVVVYRPGSSPVTAAFFTELADLLDRLSTSADALVLAGDVNIRLERAADPATTEFCDLITGYGLTQHVTGATHDAGGTLDVVCTRSDLPTPTVDIVDVGLSDHRLLLWTTTL